MIMTYVPPVCRMCSKLNDTSTYCQSMQKSKECKHQWEKDEPDPARQRIKRIMIGAAVVFGILSI